MIMKIIFYSGLMILVAGLSMAQVWKAPDQEKAKEIEQIAQQLKEMEMGGNEKAEDLKYIG